MAGSSKKHLGVGILLALSFLGVLGLIFSPIFGDGKNGLVFADDLFNKLSKGSSYFIPEVTESNRKFMGKMINVTIKVDKPEDKPGDSEKRAELIAKILTAASATVEVKGAELKIAGDLGKMLDAALKDSEIMYRNEGAKLNAQYGGDDERKLFRQWWTALSKINKKLILDKKLEEAKMVSEVMKRGVETAYNYYGIEAQKVSDKAVLMTSLLLFYILYTLWWGFGIFYIFEGIGLTMSKSKVKKEV